jgi:hypothetical protein
MTKSKSPTDKLACQVDSTAEKLEAIVQLNADEVSKVKELLRAALTANLKLEDEEKIGRILGHALAAL